MKNARKAHGGCLTLATLPLGTPPLIDRIAARSELARHRRRDRRPAVLEVGRIPSAGHLYNAPHQLGGVTHGRSQIALKPDFKVLAHDAVQRPSAAQSVHRVAELLELSLEDLPRDLPRNDLGITRAIKLIARRAIAVGGIPFQSSTGRLAHDLRHEGSQRSRVAFLEQMQVVKVGVHASGRLRDSRRVVRPDCTQLLDGALHDVVHSLFRDDALQRVIRDEVAASIAEKPRLAPAAGGLAHLAGVLVDLSEQTLVDGLELFGVQLPVNRLDPK